MCDFPGGPDHLPPPTVWIRACNCKLRREHANYGKKADRVHMYIGKKNMKTVVGSRSTSHFILGLYCHLTFSLTMQLDLKAYSLHEIVQHGRI